MIFRFVGVRHINGTPNVSVEGNHATVTTGPVDHNAITSLVGSNVGFWRNLLRHRSRVIESQPKNGNVWLRWDGYLPTTPGTAPLAT